MPNASDSSSAAEALLDAIGGRWALAGALAALRYREVARMTTDADYLVEWSDGLPDRLRVAGFGDVVVHADSGETPHLVVIRGSVNVDLLVAVTDYQDQALDRAVANGNVLTVEDVIIHKLLAWRSRDRDDIRSILRAGQPLNVAYLDHWTAEWDVTERWHELRDEV